MTKLSRIKCRESDVANQMSYVILGSWPCGFADLAYHQTTSGFADLAYHQTTMSRHKKALLDEQGFLARNFDPLTLIAIDEKVSMLRQGLYHLDSLALAHLTGDVTPNRSRIVIEWRDKSKWRFLFVI